ncbi:gliding-associated putative ABC transporter substrate-binding component GldG [Runella defluvii]|uniref:Gliding-associated putative ABC transporter substrate-binding component GldG n=1 Tax=Runella defluvii TaxID=370973 RepID=A0A7W5ZNT8_9BACT|nr:gliding motility-associated ABC transporter substrate-binding protein GldG [Runella defluvii]MBB3838999.1 gliding-associated putative ABC transporter substrate-binding component GldG [Runella defluvii]HAK78865.1 gliding motility-associated ABC transporter substrate-binding protein GldG [Runella sp.]HAO48869.1 gliding motility-associated ABC transporter substrate-binding protein GldG [Runella sp.]
MKSNLARIALFIGILVGINAIAAFVFFRWDLTQEKRYTISDATKKLLQNLDHQVVIKVYLTGDFPAGFERLERAIQETLESFADYGGGNVAYRFIEPTDPKLQEELIGKGLIPTNLFANEEGKRTERLVFPGAVLVYEGKEYPVQLLKGNKSATSEEQLNQSYEGVEFELASAIRRLAQKDRKRIGVLVGHTKVPPPRFSDFLANLQQNYDLYFDVQNPDNWDKGDLLVIPKPDSPFSEDEKYRLDQFVMRGGKLLMFADGARVDSVSLEGTFAQPLDVNLDDLLFKYGCRINQNLIKDLSCAMIPLNVGNMGDKPQIQSMPWRFFPLINNFGKHPIVRNLDALYTRFPSSIDTIQVDGIKKTPLLLTSRYTQLRKAPVLVGYNEARQQPDPREYNAGEKPIAVLLEGSFSSLYNNRLLPNDPRTKSFLGKSKPTQIIVVSDGDLIVNDIDYKRNAPLPLGYDRLSGNTFANRDFALYAVDYLADSEGLITARNKQVTLRPLDKLRLKEERTQWQLLNLLGPLVLIGVVGLVWQWNRKRQYGS